MVRIDGATWDWVSTAQPSGLDFEGGDVYGTPEYPVVPAPYYDSYQPSYGQSWDPYVEDPYQQQYGGYTPFGGGFSTPNTGFTDYGFGQSWDPYVKDPQQYGGYQGFQDLPPMSQVPMDFQGPVDYSNPEPGAWYPQPMAQPFQQSLAQDYQSKIDALNAEQYLSEQIDPIEQQRGWLINKSQNVPAAPWLTGGTGDWQDY